MIETPRRVTMNISKITVALATLVTLGGSVVATVGAGPAGAHAPVPHAAARASTTKLVGADGVAMAIPKSWRFDVDASPCFDPTKPFYTIAEHTDVVYACPAQPPHSGHQTRPKAVSSLVIDDDLAHPQPATEPDGVHCTGRGDRHTCARSWRVGDVQFDATIAGDRAAARAGLARLGRSITTLLDDQVAVPSWALVPARPHDYGYGHRESAGTYAATLEDDGLTGIEGSYDEYSRDTEPAQGAVVATGSKVIVGTKKKGPQQPVPPDPSAPKGMKLAGARDGAIAVPLGWKQVDDPVCGGTEGLDKAYVLTQPHPAVVPCPAQPEPAHAGNHVVLTRVAGDAHTADDGVVTCDHSTCRAHYFAGGIRFDVTTYGQGAEGRADRIGASVQTLPQGFDAVPLWPTRRDGALVDARKYGDLVLAAGFALASIGDVEHATVVRPAQGTVLPSGSTVRLGKR